VIAILFGVQLSIDLGIWLLVYGVMEIFAAFRLRGLARASR
jgi:hypothetical protein